MPNIIWLHRNRDNLKREMIKKRSFLDLSDQSSSVYGVIPMILGERRNTGLSENLSWAEQIGTDSS